MDTKAKLDKACHLLAKATRMRAAGKLDKATHDRVEKQFFSYRRLYMAEVGQVDTGSRPWTPCQPAHCGPTAHPVVAPVSDTSMGEWRTYQLDAFIRDTRAAKAACTS